MTEGSARWVAAVLLWTGLAASVGSPAGAAVATAAAKPEVAKAEAAKAEKNAACGALAASVAAGRAPLGELVVRCKPRDVALAVLGATTTPVRAGFVTGAGTGTGVTSEFPFGPTSVWWQGTCFARLKEGLPPSDRLPPTRCLGAATVREESLPERLEDQRASWLMDSPDTLARWRSCRKSAPSERCLERLLPLRGPPAIKHPEGARWLVDRDASLAQPAEIREAHCRVALTDPTAGVLAFRCEGPLVEAACRKIATASFDSLTEETCAPDGKSAVLVDNLGPSPSEPCVSAARTALGISRERFPAARAAALAACARDRRPPEPGDRKTPVDDPDDEEALVDDELNPSSVALIHRVLARQQGFFGAFALPRPCARAGGGCVEEKDEWRAAVVSRGCGTTIWALQPLSAQGYGDGSWESRDNRWLARFPSGARPRATYGGTPVFLGNTFRAGNYFGRGFSGGARIYKEADLVEESCVDNKGDSNACAAFAEGGHPSDVSEHPSRVEWQRLTAKITADWPRASRRLLAWQTALQRGLRLDETNVELERQTCTPLLADACTGDLGEVCARLSAQEPRCEGERLPDGRCRQVHFFRLPRLPARALPQKP